MTTQVLPSNLCLCSNRLLELLSKVSQVAMVPVMIVDGG